MSTGHDEARCAACGHPSPCECAMNAAIARAFRKNPALARALKVRVGGD